MGDVQFTGNEYLVYLPNGTKRLGIKHPDYLPTTIVFADYGTKTVASGTTYQLKVKANKKRAKVDNSKKGMAVFNIKPSNAMLLIDGQIADGSGGVYTLQLPCGTHYYTVKIKDFSLNNQIVHIDKDAKTINVDLTEFFAKVDVSCKTADAEITVNGEQKGIGSWSSMVAPGSYTIEASKDGCHSQTRFIQLRDNETARVDFTTLKTITGSLRVDYEPAGADVLLNGKKVGVSPLVLKELPVGDYQLEIWKEYYIKEFYTIKIQEDKEWRESGKLKETEFGHLVEYANEGYPLMVADYYRYGSCSGGYGDAYTCSQDTTYVPFNPVRAIYWYKKYKKRCDEEGSYLIEEAIKALGPLYPSSNDDEALSFAWAKAAVDEIETWENNYFKYNLSAMWQGNPYAPLAWHYFYGVGCGKDLEKAKQMMRWACNEDGTYRYPAFTELIKEMGLDAELKYKKGY
ncbi:MAG: PEGA domain-containing protein [Prevotella sp.]|nr:PEGA domain-containing protein [Prevotella sp.]